MVEPFIVEQFADNGEHSHWQIIDKGNDCKVLVEDFDELNELTMGVGFGDGNLYIHGSHNSIKELQRKIIAFEKLNRGNTLASILYEDLKEKYILLKQERDNLAVKLFKANKRINKLTSNLGPLRFGRKQFNLGVKLAKDLVLEVAIEHKFELDPICKLIGRIEELRKPPITEDNKEIMNDVDVSIIRNPV